MNRTLALLILLGIAILAFSQPMLRPSAMVAFDEDRWLIADGGSGEFLLIDSTANGKRHSFGAAIREPVALARDGIYFLCFDRSNHTIVKFNRRLELVETTALPIEYRNRFGECLAVTQFGERLLIETDRNEIIAFDGFAKETWRIPLPVTQRVIGLTICGDSIAVLFDSSDTTQRGLFTTRFGGSMKQWSVPTGMVPAHAIVSQDRSCWLLGNNKLWQIGTDSSSIHIWDSPSTQPLLAASNRRSLAIYSATGLRILPWR